MGGMWMFTKDGFFSTVKDRYCGDNEVVVRARVREDLERFCARFGIGAEAIKTFSQADYAFRVQVLQSEWAQYVQDMAASIDYPNFKGTVIARDHDRHRAYMECWQALHDWQEMTMRINWINRNPTIWRDEELVEPPPWLDR